MRNKLCALSHDALDRRRCNGRGRSSTSFVDHANTPGNGHFPNGNGHVPPGHFRDTRVRRDTTESASNQLTDQLTITSRR